MNFISSNFISHLKHPREKLPQPAVSVLDTNLDKNFQCSYCFITRQDFDSRMDFIASDIWKIEIFCKFIENNIDTVNNDVKVFSRILKRAFTDMMPIHFKGNFKKVCSSFQFEFLMFHLFRDHAR